MERGRAHVFVEGRVQGVFFRSETQQIAKLHNLKGWVRNLPDRRVEAVFEGMEDDVEKMIEWCRKGPKYAVVNNVEVNREDFKGEFDEFSISY
jgi:acylphosphatase